MTDLSHLSTAKDSIGRYFSLVSVLPSTLLVAWVVLLVGSGAWRSEPDPTAAIGAFSELGVGGTAGLVIASLATGVVLHPMQFAFVQFLEGYWGVSPLARRLRSMRIKTHRRRLLQLREEAAQLARQITDIQRRSEHASQEEQDRLAWALVDLQSVRQEIHRITSSFPRVDPGAVMPTRLGNILRYHEWQVGKVYGIATVATTPYLSRTSDPGDMEYVNDQRSQLDLAVRMSIVGFIATGLTTLFLVRHGLWLLVALVPYAVAYTAYRGAVVIAGEYGRALGVLVTLNRFALYERLRLPPVSNTADERRQNEVLMRFLTHRATSRSSLTYRSAPDPPSPS